jgi:lysozyme family protein
MTTYTEALKFVLQWEGGFVDDPDDHGGRTNKGITQKVYNAYLVRLGRPGNDVKDITDAEVADIYRNNYWLVAKCDKLSSELAFCHFDTAVNMGTNRAAKILQRASGCSEDGVIGSQTLEACTAIDEKKAIVAYCSVRDGLYHAFASKPGQQKFLKGWMNRLNSLRVALHIQAPSRDRVRPEPTQRIPDVVEGAGLDA